MFEFVESLGLAPQSSHPPAFPTNIHLSRLPYSTRTLDAMSALHAKLIATSSVAPRRIIMLHDFPLRLGRSPAADVCLDDRWVSRDHCEIDVDGHGLIVRDLGSKHGTYVNGRAVTHTELHSGDEISVGLTRFVVEFEPDSDSAHVAEEAYV